MAVCYYILNDQRFMYKKVNSYVHVIILFIVVGWPGFGSGFTKYKSIIFEVALAWFVIAFEARCRVWWMVF